MYTLIICEKPDVARSISSVIDRNITKKDGFLIGDKYIFTWAIGHLLQLAPPSVYDPKYEQWDLEHLPIIPSPFKLIPNPKTKKQLRVISECAKKSIQIVNACDAGREGQVIFAYIYDYLRLTLPVKRLWVSSLTPEAIKYGFQNLKNEEEFKGLTEAGKARGQSDWIVGLNATRAFSSKYSIPGQVLSVGRVQTPTLSMILSRQEEIEEFKPETYYEVEAQFQQGNLLYKGTWLGDRIFTKEAAESLANKTRGKTGYIKDFITKPGSEAPPLLYNLTLLQKDANTKYGFSTKETSDIGQSLYEKHKCITYIRTSSSYIAKDNIPSLHQAIQKLGQLPAYAELVQHANFDLVHEKNKRIVNPEKIADHHAILITECIPTGLTSDEEKLYDLIAQRCLAHFYPAVSFKHHTILSEVDNEVFRTRVKEINNDGWKVVYKDKSLEEATNSDDGSQVVSSLFSVNVNSPVFCGQATCIEKETTPPSWYTEGTLVLAMETAGKGIKIETEEDQEIYEAMKENGIGTSATRADIIETLKERNYITIQGKRIIVTDTGQALISLIRDTGLELLLSPSMTGQWEKYLNDIVKNKNGASRTTFLKNIEKFTKKIIDTVKNTKSTSKEIIPSQLVIGSCPACSNGQIIEGKKAFGCSEWKEGCSFKIWKQVYNKKLTVKNVRELITQGITPEMSFVSPNKGNYKARLKVKDKNTGDLELIFEKKESKSIQNKDTSSNDLGNCPMCKSEKIIDKGKFFGCTGYPSCKFTISKSIAKKKLSLYQIKKLLSTGKTDTIKGFKGTNKDFEAKLVIINNKIEFEYSKNNK